MFGVHEYIADVARRFAKAGYLAIAPELFVRQGDAQSYGEIAKLLSEVVNKVPDAQVMGDLDASVAWAKANGGDTARLGITGFCWGGRQTWLYDAHNPAVKAAVAWYGRLLGAGSPLQPKHPMEVVGTLNGPVLGLYGGDDTGIPQESVEQMKKALAGGSAAAKKSEFVVYPARRTRSMPTTGRATARKRPTTAGSAASRGSRRTASPDRHDAAIRRMSAARRRPSAPSIGVPRATSRDADDSRTPPMTLAYIIAATFLGGLLSVLVAASLTIGVLTRVVHHLVSLSAGVLLGTALLDVLPEAFERHASPQKLFLTLLLGLLFFFLLEKAELYRHSHHHEGDDHHHHHGFDEQQAGRGGWSVILGDSIHNFCDGIIIAAAFLADTRLGVVTSLAIIAHEIPQEVGDYIVLLNAGFSRAKALFYNALSGLAAVVGGIVGYFIVGPWEALFPYLLVVAASSFIYVAVADLIPQLQHRLTLKETVAQLGWLGAGLLIVVLAVSQLHR